MKKTILVCCTDGASYRNYVGGGLLDLLLETFNVVLICAEWMKKSISPKTGLILEVVYTANKFESLIDHARFTPSIYPPAMYPTFTLETFKIKRLREQETAPMRLYSRLLINKLVKPRISRSILRTMAWIGGKKSVQTIFTAHQISAVVSLNMLCVDHIPYVEFAQTNKIPVLSTFISWDNMTSKGTLLYIPDKLLVWSPKMAFEANKYHKLAKSHVAIVGAAQFDAYLRKDIPTREDFSARLKLPVDAKVVTYIGGIPQNIVGLTSDVEIAVLRSIVDAIDSGKLKHTYLVVRPHPGVSDWKQYDEFVVHKHVRINYPQWYLDKKDPPKTYNTDWKDHLFLASILKYSAVIVTPGGSSTLDASCFDTPVVNVAFDMVKKPYLQSLASHCDFTHLQYIRDYKASPFVYSTKDLIKEVGMQMKNPKKYSAGRQALVKNVIGPRDGKSNQRIVDVIKRVI